jgi:hypothetical protein
MVKFFGGVAAEEWSVSSGSVQVEVSLPGISVDFYDDEKEGKIFSNVMPILP